MTPSNCSHRCGFGPFGYFIAPGSYGHISDTMMVWSLLIISLNVLNHVKSVSVLCSAQIEAMLSKANHKEALFTNLYIQSKFSLQGFRWPFCGGLWNVRVTLFHPEWWSKLSGRDRGMETFRPVRPSYVRSLTPEPIKEKNEVLHLTYVTPPTPKKEKKNINNIQSHALDCFLFFIFLHWCSGKGEQAGARWVWSLYNISPLCFLGVFLVKDVGL